MELRAILEILWRRKSIILAVFLSIFLTVMVSTYLITTWYDATAKVFLRRSAVASSVLASLGMQGQSTGSASSLSDTDRADYLALSSLRPVAENAIAELNLKRLKTRTRIMRAMPFMKPVLKFLGVDVSAEEGTITGEELTDRPLLTYLFPRPYIYCDQYESTDIITIEALSTNPEEASKMANTMAKAFVADELRRVREDFTGAKEYIQQNIKRYNTEYTKALRGLRDFREREKTVNLDAEISEYIKQISDLKQSQRDLYLSLAATKTKFGATHPAVIDLQNQIDETKRFIQEKTDKIFGPDVESVNPYAADLAPKKNRPSTPAQNAEKAGVPEKQGGKREDELFQGLPEKYYKYAQLNLTVTVTQDIYNSLLKALYQVGIAESIAVSNIYIVESAVTPQRDSSKHIHPSKTLNFAIAVFLGVFFGVGSALLVEYLDDTLRTSDDIKIYKGLTFLGSIHKLRKKESRLINKMDPRSPLREIFRTIRNNIRFADPDKKIKSYAITSSIQGEGKSFFAVNLAISFANGGKKVLLIDGDMRRPSVHSYFKVDNSTGLTSYLVGDLSYDEILVQTSVDGLTIIPTGAIPPDPAKLVESKKMQQLIKTMEDRYDMVIIDSPPVFAANDAVIMGGYVGAMMIIIESGRASRKHFYDVIDMFSKANVNVLGVVLNKASGTRAPYYYYQYEYRQ